MLPLCARVDLGAMPMKRFTAFPKAPALLEPHHQSLWGWSYPSAEMQSVYSTAPADWATGCCIQELPKVISIVKRYLKEYMLSTRFDDDDDDDNVDESSSKTIKLQWGAFTNVLYFRNNFWLMRQEDDKRFSLFLGAFTCYKVRIKLVGLFVCFFLSFFWGCFLFVVIFVLLLLCFLLFFFFCFYRLSQTLTW